MKKNLQTPQTIGTYSENVKQTSWVEKPEILFVTSFPSRECGIATYSNDLISAIANKFENSFQLNVCALETVSEKNIYDDNVTLILKTDDSKSYSKLATNINNNPNIQVVVFQHEFGLYKNNEADFLQLLEKIQKPIVTVFHTILPKPNEYLIEHVQHIAKFSDEIIVMTQHAANILKEQYQIAIQKINVIPHGTHLVKHTNKEDLKQTYNFKNRKILATFGLLGSGKSIETTLDALPEIIQKNPSVLFLIIGKTHPNIVKSEGEVYRNFLMTKIQDLDLENHVQFINEFLPTEDLLEYLQLTDIYLFTSKDPNQAVSGTFSYAMSCGCAIISTPIPHAVEFLNNETGIIIDFENSNQLAQKVNLLLKDKKLIQKISLNGLHKIASSSWENAALSHMKVFKKIAETNLKLELKIPKINLSHIKSMTTKFGIIQFSVINQPDITSGYTLDDNARALVAFCQHYQLTKDEKDLEFIKIYLDFITFCLVYEGNFLNYVNENKKFTEQNKLTNLDDSNGRAIWALGYVLSINNLPVDLEINAQKTLQVALKKIDEIHSTRAMAFAIKGIYYSNNKNYNEENVTIIKKLADRLVQMYKHESKQDWLWFESYLTYANSVLPEAMLCAYLSTRETIYKNIAINSFDFLLSKIFVNNTIKVISNKGWLLSKDDQNNPPIGGEQPIDVAYTIMALSKFYDAFGKKQYAKKMKIAFDWFLGKNHLNQIVYNPCTGGCYDGLEENYINLNQGAESTASYLMARLTIEKYKKIIPIEIKHASSNKLTKYKSNKNRLQKITLLNQ